jgi:hypothetical protein
MKKIMFNDKYGLTAAVLNGKKTMTRRAVPAKLLQKYGHNKFNDRSKDLIFDAQFSIGEVVAVAQRYSDIADDKFFVNEIAADELTVNAMKYEHGWNNKQGVKACYMPHRIRITDIKIERLQDISNDDCLKEGIKNKSCFPRKPAFPYYFEGGKHRWDNSFSTPRKAFAALIDKVSGKGTWESNPWVFAYTFELID